jgi:hypothetical protein
MGALLFTDPEYEDHVQEPLAEPTTIDFEPDGCEGFFHAAIKNGAGVLVDGEQRNRDKLIESIEAVLGKLGTDPNGGVKAARGQFLTDVCRIFKLPTTIGTGDVVDQASVIEDLRQLPETLVSGSDEVITRTTKPVGPMTGNVSNSDVLSLNNTNDDDADDYEGDDE